MIEIAPSILSADFTKLGSEIQVIESGGAGVLHVDVMDGRFVPNITVGLPVVKSISKVTNLPIDCHLMIEEPGKFAVQFVEAGASMVSVHIEEDLHIHRTLTAIREAGGKSGIAINPGTSLSMLDEALPFADFVLIMSVNPGFGGQKFIETSIPKVRSLKKMILERGLSTRIEIDGGIDINNIGKVVEAGVEIVVAGSSVYGKKNPAAAVQELLNAATSWI